MRSRGTARHALVGTTDGAALPHVAGGAATGQECISRALSLLDGLHSDTAPPAAGLLGSWRGAGSSLSRKQARGVVASAASELWATALGVDASRVDVTEATRRWWTSQPEPASNVNARVEQLLLQLRHAADEAVVLVGHSHFFRELLDARLHPCAGVADPALAAGLGSCKLRHCNIACCELDFAHAERPIVSVAFLAAADDGTGRRVLRSATVAEATVP